MSRHSIKAGIVGGAGYTGGEMLRILLQHPHVEIAFVHSRSNAGAPVYKVHTDLLGETDLIFSSAISPDVDVLFLCVGHGEASKFLQEHIVSQDTVIIDLSQDFRLSNNAKTRGRDFVYGLPEYNKELITKAKSIANPGCFATAIQLALLPLAQKGMLNEVHVTGITGATGAGQKLQASSHFAWRANNIQAYKSLSHQHVAEIKQTLQAAQSNFDILHFVPWRGDFTRGIYISAYTKCSATLEEAYDMYHKAYDVHPFTHVAAEMVDLKQVVGTNKCLVHLEKVDDNLIIHAAIDNLLKGASGQAVQNMNLVFGLPEDAGLKLKATAF